MAHWPDLQSQGVSASRIPIHTVQELILDDLPACELSSAKPVGDWRFPLAQALDDATWSLPPSAKKNLDVVGPSTDPEPEVEEGQYGDDVIIPWFDESAPPGAIPPPDQKPLYDLPFVYHGGECLQDAWGT